MKEKTEHRRHEPPLSVQKLAKERSDGEDWLNAVKDYLDAVKRLEGSRSRTSERETRPGSGFSRVQHPPLDHSLDLTRLKRAVKAGLRTYSALAGKGWVEDDIDRKTKIIVPMIEQFVGFVVSLATAHVPISSVIPKGALASMFGVAHTESSMAFRIFAGLWGYASLSAVMAAEALGYGWILQVLVAAVLAALQIHFNLRQETYLQPLRRMASSA